MAKKARKKLLQHFNISTIRDKRESDTTLTDQFVVICLNPGDLPQSLMEIKYRSYRNHICNVNMN